MIVTESEFMELMQTDHYGTSLPEGIGVVESLDLINCALLESLPKGLKINGSLRLPGIGQIESLPDDLEVRESLYLSGCDLIRSIPGTIKVGGSIFLQAKQESFEDFKSDNCKFCTVSPDVSSDYYWEFVYDGKTHRRPVLLDRDGGSE